MTTRPLPPTPYTGPIISMRRPLPVTPPRAAPLSTPDQASTPTPILKRRPHTRRLQTAPSAALPSVSEEEECEIAEEPFKPKRRPRPSPLIPSRTYPLLPLIVEIPDVTPVSHTQPAKIVQESLALSPSTLLARRRSETILDFPLPPHTHSLPTPVTPPFATSQSPTPSHASTSTASSSPYPLTPHPSDDEETDVQPSSGRCDVHDGVAIDGYDHAVDARSPRQPHRSASVLSLRNFITDEFDAHTEGIYALMHPRPKREAEAPKAGPLQAIAEQKEELTQVGGGRSPRLVLSVIDPTRGGSFNVPLVLGSFLSPPSSPSSLYAPASNTDDDESDGEGIPTWSDGEADSSLFEPAQSSSEDDASDDEGPRRFLDPTFRTSSRRLHRRRVSRLPPLPALEEPDTPSVYSVASPVDWGRERTPPRESLVPSDVSFPSQEPLAPFDVHSPTRPLSPFEGTMPPLRSRFSTSTLASLPPEPPTSARHAFLARLTGRTRPPLPLPPASKSERPALSPRASLSMRRKRAHLTPLSPAPSAFSFSTHSSRTSLDSASESACSCASDESTVSAGGLRRPPIPIELFLRG